MKILQLGKFYPIKGGVERVMYDLLEGISEQRIQVDMLCASDCNKSHEIIVNDYAKIYCTATWIKMLATMISPQMIWKLRAIASEYEIIHVHHPDPMATLALFLSGYKGKVVLHWHSDILKQKIALKLIMPLQNWLINRADVIVGTTPKYLEESPYLQKAKLKKIAIPIGIDTVLCDNNKVDEIKKRYENKTIIFSLGRLVGYKGFSYLIESALSLPDDYVVLIGGGGPLKAELENQINRLELHNKVHLLGRISEEELPSYFAACDVYVMSSIWKTEAFGIVQIEAMSCGKPIVATKIPGSGVSWVNEDKVTGLNVEPENADEIADAILKITSNREAYMTYSNNAKKRYEQLFQKEMMIEKCLALYKNL